VKAGTLAANVNEDIVDVVVVIVVGAFNSPPSTESPPDHRYLSSDYFTHNYPHTLQRLLSIH